MITRKHLDWPLLYGHVLIWNPYPGSGFHWGCTGEAICRNNPLSVFPFYKLLIEPEIIVYNQNREVGNSRPRLQHPQMRFISFFFKFQISYFGRTEYWPPAFKG